jgi:hypothetical protein
MSYSGPILPMSKGGSSSSLTPSANSLVYSSASGMALLATVNSAFLLTNGSGVPALSVTGSITQAAGGEINWPLQPSFSAYNSAADAGQTKGTFVTVQFDTELYDQNADFASNTFTAPVTGKYQFNIGVDISGINTATRYEAILLVTGTSGRQYNLWRINPTAAIATGSDTMGMSASVAVPMTATDTAIVQVFVDGGTSTYTIQGNSSPGTHFSGFLVA